MNKFQRALVLVCSLFWVAAHSAESQVWAHPRSGIVADRQGNIYFIGREFGLARISPSGKVTRIHMTYNRRQISPDHRLTIDRQNGDLYFIGFEFYGICRLRFNKEMRGEVSIRKLSTLPLQVGDKSLKTTIYNSTPLAVNSKGLVYLTQMAAFRGSTKKARYQIIGIDPSGKTQFVAGGEHGHRDGKGPKAQFRHFYDSGMAVGPDDTLYLTDGGTCIRRVKPCGAVSTLAGSTQRGFRDGKGAQARFNRIVGIDVDKKGNVYVADSENRRIRKVTPSGVVSTVAGNGHIKHVDGPALKASFIRPVGVAVGTKGDIYILDSNDVALKVSRTTVRVRRLTADGRVVTVVEVRGGKFIGSK